MTCCTRPYLFEARVTIRVCVQKMFGFEANLSQILRYVDFGKEKGGKSSRLNFSSACTISLHQYHGSMILM